MIGNFNEEAQTILNNAKKEMIGTWTSLYWD